MRRSLATIVSIALMGVGLAAVAGPAQAQDVKNNAGDCPSKNSVMTSTAQHSVSGYMCAQENHNGDTSIGPDETHSYTISTNTDYSVGYDCYDTTSSSVTVAPAKVIGSATYTATNWLAASLTEDNTRHWSAAMLWTIQGEGVTGFTNGCSVSDEVWTNPPNIDTVTYFTASGMPDNNQAVAGTAYNISVAMSPASATGQVGLQDSSSATLPGTSVAGGVITNGVAKFTWTPAISGTRYIKIVYGGDANVTPATTDAIQMTVTDGIGLQITGITSDPATGKATATVNVTPASLTSNVNLVDLSQPNASTGAPSTVVGQAAASSGTASITWTPGGNTNHNYVANVMNAAHTSIGQSYVYNWVSPPIVTLSNVPATTYQYMSANITINGNPAPASGSVVTVYDGNTVANGTWNGANSDGIGTFTWIPTTTGTHTLHATYQASSGGGIGQSPSVTSTVQDGYKLEVTSVKDTSAGHATATVSVTPASYTGTVYLYSGSTTTKPASSSNGTQKGSAKPVGGIASIPFTYPTTSSGTWYLRGYVSTSSTAYWYSDPFDYTFESSSGGASSGALMDSSGITKLELPGEEIVRAAAAKTAPLAKRPSGHSAQASGPAAGPAVASDMTLVEQSMKVTSSGSRALSAVCPEGQTLLHADTMTDGPASNIGVSMTTSGAKFTSPKENAGHIVKTQLVCRPTTAELSATAGYALGTPRADVIAVTAAGGTGFAGPGDDSMVGSGSKSVLWGGLGNDRLVVSGKDSVAVGGPGRDHLTAEGSARVMLTGGEGLDRLVGSTGASVLNAVDGRGGDRVVCHSPQNVVHADKGDIIAKSCTNVTFMQSS